MWKPTSKHMSVVAAVAVASASAVFSDAAIAAPFDQTFDAGQACDFELGANFGGGDQNMHDNGKKQFRTGVAGPLTLTNVSTGKSITLPKNGSNGSTVTNADGSSTITLTGHNVWISFPTDVPAGPSTTLYVGRVVIHNDPEGNSTLISTSGRAIDLCAALS